jgi:hypothetical protein
MFVGNFGNRAEGAKAAGASHTVGSDGHIGPALNPPTQLQAEPTLSASWPATGECRVSVACDFSSIEDPCHRATTTGVSGVLRARRPEEHRTHRALAVFSGPYICRYSLPDTSRFRPATWSPAFCHQPRANVTPGRKRLIYQSSS